MVFNFHILLIPQIVNLQYYFIAIENILCDFTSFKFIEACFITLYMDYREEYSECIREECAFCCRWIECFVDAY